LPQLGGPRKITFCPSRQESQRVEIADLRLIERWLEGEVEAVERLDRR
jgi:hypothetical protein